MMHNTKYFEGRLGETYVKCNRERERDVGYAYADSKETVQSCIQQRFVKENTMKSQA